jgi:hypothetical protein
MITLPNPKVDLLVAIRNGKYARGEIESMGKQFEADAESAQSKSPLPEKVDLAAVTTLVTRVYLEFWRAQK